MNLQWQYVNFERRIVTFMDTKNGENRTVPLSTSAFNLLKEHSKLRKINSPYLFPRLDGKAPIELRKHWYAAIKKAAVKEKELKNFRFHDLRHTAASYLAMSDASLMELSTILGHKTLQMVKRYSHLTDQHTAKVLERMDEMHFKNKNESS